MCLTSTCSRGKEHTRATDALLVFHWWWRHPMKWKHFPRYWPFVRGIHRSPGNSPYKGQWRGALMFSLICTWINGWVNNREAGDSGRHCAHYDVIVMFKYHITDAWRFDQRWQLHNTPGDWFILPVWKYVSSVVLSNRGPLLLTWINFIPAWGNNLMLSKVWDEIN